MDESGDRPRDVVRVLGVGNVLMGDDALGPYVARMIEAQFELPESVEVLDAGTPGQDLLSLIAGASAVIVVDAVLRSQPPGTIQRLSPAEVHALPGEPRLGPHQANLVDALQTLELVGETPEAVIVGAVPASTATGVGLSPAVRAALPLVVEAVEAEVERLGHRLARRESPSEPDIWWEDGR